MTTSTGNRGRLVAPRRGRPPKPLDPDASRAARLGAELRTRREAQNLTLQALSDRIHYSPQHISQVEHGRAMVTEAFVQACDAGVGTDGTLMRCCPTSYWNTPRSVPREVPHVAAPTRTATRKTRWIQPAVAVW